jgi:hypothetical protein
MAELLLWSKVFVSQDRAGIFTCKLHTVLKWSVYNGGFSIRAACINRQLKVAGVAWGEKRLR